MRSVFETTNDRMNQIWLNRLVGGEKKFSFLGLDSYVAVLLDRFTFSTPAVKNADGEIDI